MTDRPPNPAPEPPPQADPFPEDYPEGCEGVPEPEVFRCAEQLFWDVLRTDLDRRRDAYERFGVLATELADSEHHALLSRLHFQRGQLAMGPTPVNRRLYADVDPTASPDFVTKTGLLAEIDITGDGPGHINTTTKLPFGKFVVLAQVAAPGDGGAHRAHRLDRRLDLDAHGPRGHVALSTTAADALQAYQWPGNVRQLFNVLRTAVVMAAGGLLAAPS